MHDNILLKTCEKNFMALAKINMKIYYISLKFFFVSSPTSLMSMPRRKRGRRRIRQIGQHSMGSVLLKKRVSIRLVLTLHN